MIGDLKPIRIIIAGIVVVVLVGVFWYIPVKNQATEENLVTIGIARWGPAAEYDRNIEGFKDGLAGNGYVEGDNVRFITQDAETDKGKQRQIIQSYIDQDVDLIFSITTPATLIAKEMVKDKPIVFSVATYPVEAGLIDSLESSGNNLVGTRNYISVKRQYNEFEKVYPDTKTLGFVHRKGEPNSTTQYYEMNDLLTKKGIKVVDIAAVDLNDMRSQLNSAINNIDSLYIACDTLNQNGGDEIIIEFAKKYKKPSFTCLRDGVLKGALIGNIGDFYSIGKISGRYASLILQGAKPTLLLTEGAREDFVLINIKTADELGIEIPKIVLDNVEEIVDG